jgi:transcriptional regulator with XRE-family HTH domain
MDAGTLGERIRNARRLRGLTQRELAAAAGVSESLIKKLEQGSITDARLETVHKIAVPLRVPTSRIAAGPDAAPAEESDVSAWEPVRRALEGRHQDNGEPDGEPTLAGVETVLNGIVPLLIANRFDEVRALLPALLQDADALVATSANGSEAQARGLRSRARQLTGYMMGQTWQLDTAGEAMDLALDDASGDIMTTMAAADWKCWSLLRQGQLDACRELATWWADRSEPRVSRATPDELAAWGRFLILISTASARDNRPGEAKSALKLARAAAIAIGRDIIPGFNPWQVFGPSTVAWHQAENAIIQDRPDVTLGIAAQVTGRGFPIPRNLLRHRLDVASAHASMRQYAEAAAVLSEVNRAAPEWLAHQRFARDILGHVVQRRRTLTPEMRELVDAVRLPL